MAVKGVIYTLLLLVVVMSALNIIEYFGWNVPKVRTIIFYAYIILSIVVVLIWIVWPITKLFNISKRLSFKQASNIIGEHFPEVKDKLLNLLQLQEMSLNEQENTLLTAAIEQKTRLLSPIPFAKAVNTHKTKKYAKVLCVVLLSIVGLGCIFPTLFSEPTARYLNHNTYFEKPAPFHFKLQSPLNAVQHSDYTIKVSVNGKILPEKVHVIIDGNSFEMKQIDKTLFQYTITQIQKTTSLQFEAVDVYSKIYTIQVNPKPILTDLTAKVLYPAYTHLENQTITNLTSLSVPKGTRIEWSIATKDAKTVFFNNKAIDVDKKGNVLLSRLYMQRDSIIIKAKNDYSLSLDSIAFAIDVIEDKAPQISVIEQKDSIITENIYFRGQISDDYGFSKLEFHLVIKPEGSTENKIVKKPLTVTHNEISQEFYHTENLNDYPISMGDTIEYYFIVWDNDAIQGPKSTKSQIFSFNLPNKQQVEQKLENNSSQIKQQAETTLTSLKALQEQIDNLIKKLSQKKQLSWQDEKELQSLKDKQQQVKDEIEQIKQKLEENSLIEQKYKQQNQELFDKQQQLEELFDKLQNQELEKLMQELKELSNKTLDKDKLKESLKDIQKNNEQLSKQLDKNIELFKRLEVEKDINDAINNLNDLAKQQEELSSQTKEKQLDNKALQEKQQEINDKFEIIKKKLEDIKDKDSKLEDSFNFKPHNQEQKEIQNQLQKANQELKQQKNNKASQSQKQASQMMQQMANSMQQEQEQQEQEQLAEDIENVRQILKNLVTLSKKQEELIYKTQTTRVNETSYQTIINRQNNIKNAMLSVNDSLYAISKRQTQVSKIINEQTFSAINNIDQALEMLLKFNQSYYNSYINNQASKKQQSAMSSINNLSLLLAESLDNMNKQLNSKKSNGKSGKMCNNPSSGQNGQKKSMSELQDALNKEIERLKQELDKQGGKKQKIGEGASLNEQLARAAARQEALRQAMQQYIQELKQQGGKAVGQMNQLLKQMEQTEKDIVNKSISNQTLKRQKQILTRMLESEKSQNEQGKQQKRESHSGVDQKSNPKDIQYHYNQLKNRDMELFKKVPPEYSLYYREKINHYFNNN